MSNATVRAALDTHFEPTLAVFKAACPAQTCNGFGWPNSYKDARDIVSGAKFDLDCGDAFADVVAQVTTKLTALAAQNGIAL